MRGPYPAPSLSNPLESLVVPALAAAFVLAGLALDLSFGIARFIASTQCAGAQSEQRNEGDRAESSIHVTTPLGTVNRTVRGYPKRDGLSGFRWPSGARCA